MDVQPVYESRRPDHVGVHSLDHFSFAVPDLEEACRFYKAFGVVARYGSAGIELSCAGDPHVWAVITLGPRKRLGHVSFGAFPDDLPRFAARLSDAGIETLQPPEGFASNGLWFRDSHGMLIEIRAAPKVMPDAKRPLDYAPLRGARGAPLRSEAAPVAPKRLAHALMFTPVVAESIRFHSEILGLRLSDHPGPVAFLHGAHGSDHHLIAFAQSTDIGLHHSAWDVSSIDEVGIGAAHMAEEGYAEGWGLGRHVLGSNYFHYVRDPWGSYAEYSFDIDYVPVEQDWEAGYPAPENSLSLWGPDVPPDFITNHEAAELAVPAS